MPTAGAISASANIPSRAAPAADRAARIKTPVESATRNASKASRITRHSATPRYSLDGNRDAGSCPHPDFFAREVANIPDVLLRDAPIHDLGIGELLFGHVVQRNDCRTFSERRLSCARNRLKKSSRNGSPIIRRQFRPETPAMADSTQTPKSDIGGKNMLPALM